jgi:hypothetical protein
VPARFYNDNGIAPFRRHDGARAASVPTDPAHVAVGGPTLFHRPGLEPHPGSGCARGQAENLIKRHKSQLASDRTSCRSPLANQMRLILHTAAYWLMLMVRNAIAKPQALASGEFSTIRLRLLKIAVRIKETTTRVRPAFAANCPDAELFRGLLGTLILRPT